jgi:RNA polymerase sigma-70 factor (ECF subfamily)
MFPGGFADSEPKGLPVSLYAHDDALVIRLRERDEQAYAELYRRVHPRVFGFALRRLGDPTEAEDVAQDVFLEVYRSIEQYEGRSSLLSWIFGIAHHTTLKRFSHRSREMTPLDEAGDLAAPAASIEDRIDASRIWEHCVRSLQRNVSGTARHMFHLRYSQGRSVEAIARETGKSAGAVKVGLMRTRRILGAWPWARDAEARSRRRSAPAAPRRNHQLRGAVPVDAGIPTVSLSP